MINSISHLSSSNNNVAKNHINLNNSSGKQNYINSNNVNSSVLSEISIKNKNKIPSNRSDHNYNNSNVAERPHKEREGIEEKQDYSSQYSQYYQFNENSLKK